MFTASSFKTGSLVYRSSFYDKDYYILELIKLTKTPKRVSRRGIFYYEAKVIASFTDSKPSHPESYGHSLIGTSKVWNSCFTYNSMEDLCHGVQFQKYSSMAIVSERMLADKNVIA